MVPCFLALSGFLVLKSYGESRGWLHFAWKRALRILPALSLAVVLAGLLLGPWAIFDSIKCWVSMGHWANTANGSLWSLGWEEIAYGLLAILFTLKFYEKPWIIWLLWAGAICLSCCLETKPDDLWRTVHLAPAFFTGNLAYIYRNQMRQIPWIAAFGVLGTALVINWMFPPVTPNPLGYDTKYVVMACAAVLIFCVSAPRVLPKRFPDISYGLYVFHDPVLKTVAGFSFVSSYWSVLGVGFAALIPLGIASWYFVEKPALSAKNSLPSIRKALRTDRRAVVL